MKLYFLFLLSVSCAFQGKPREGKTAYSFTDVSGNYKLVRESKNIQKKLVTRNQLMDTKGSQNRVLEKSILVSQVGSIKNNGGRLLTVRPMASEFVVWLEGKKYSTRMRLSPETKSMQLTLKSPEAKWNGSRTVPFPKGKYFCFFNQIPECLYHNYLLTLAQSKPRQKFDFFLIWDGYPYIQDQLSYVGKNLFTAATVKYDGEFKKQFRYIVEVEGQMILYTFTRSFDLAKIAWITQGITIVPPGEEIVDE